MPERTAPSASARKRIVQASTTAAAEPVISSPVENPNHCARHRVDLIVEPRQREQQAEPDDAARQGIADRGEPDGRRASCASVTGARR